MRILIAIVGFLGVVFAAPWVPLLCIVLLSLRYRSWEALGIGMCTDLVWLSSGTHAFPLYTLSALVIVWGLEPLRLQFLR